MYVVYKSVIIIHSPVSCFCFLQITPAVPFSPHPLPLHTKCCLSSFYWNSSSSASSVEVQTGSVAKFRWKSVIWSNNSQRRVSRQLKQGCWVFCCNLGKLVIKQVLLQLQILQALDKEVLVFHIRSKSKVPSVIIYRWEINAFKSQGSRTLLKAFHILCGR